MRAAMGSGAVIERSTPVLTFSPGVREQAESRASAPASMPRAVPAPPGLRPPRSNLPIIPRIARRSSFGVRGLLESVARAASTSEGRATGRLLAILVALAALGLFAGLNMRSLTGAADGSAMAEATATATVTTADTAVTVATAATAAAAAVEARRIAPPQRKPHTSR